MNLFCKIRNRVPLSLDAHNTNNNNDNDIDDDDDGDDDYHNVDDAILHTTYDALT